MSLSSIRQRARKVIGEIHDAFDGVQRGKGITLHQAAAIDQCVGAKKELAARQLDSDTTWQEVSDEDIATHDVLTFLDPSGFRYYIPAFMAWVVRNYDSASISIHDTLYNLIHHLPAERRATLNESQLAAIRSFLSFMNDVGEMDDHDRERANAIYGGTLQPPPD